MTDRVEQMRSPRWGTTPRDNVIELPSWPAVEEAVRRLNGEDYNDLHLERPDEATWLAIGGGGGRYIVMLTVAAHTDSESWLVACREADEEGTESLVVGGQAGDYPSRQIVGIETALAAAKEYLATGRPSPSLLWERT